MNALFNLKNVLSNSVKSNFCSLLLSLFFSRYTDCLNSLFFVFLKSFDIADPEKSSNEFDLERVTDNFFLFVLTVISSASSLFFYKNIPLFLFDYYLIYEFDLNYEFYS